MIVWVVVRLNLLVEFIGLFIDGVDLLSFQVVDFKDECPLWFVTITVSILVLLVIHYSLIFYLTK